MGLNIEEHDQEGRVITAEYPDFYGMHAPLSATVHGVKLSPLVMSVKGKPQLWLHCDREALQLFFCPLQNQKSV